MPTKKKISLAKKPTASPKRPWIKWAIGGAFVIALGVGAAVVLSGKKPRSGDTEDEPDTNTPSTSSSGTSNPKPVRKWKGNGFPLSKWSNGFRVKALQQALIARHGNVLPRYGADSYWGDEMQSALMNAGWPVYYSSATFAKSVGTTNSPASGSISNFHDAAWNLHSAAKSRDWSKASAILARMKSVGEYLAIRSSFITWPFRGSANFTPVNALLWAFPSRRSEVEGHFFRIGLSKTSSGKWSTNGLGSFPSRRRRIRTTKPAMIWTSEDLGIRIPAHMLLGEEVSTSGGFTEFINGNGQQFYVHTNDIAYT